MATVIIRHKVEDYAKWKAVYDEVLPFRQSSGIKGARLLRSADNPNEIVVVDEFDDMDKARQFAQSEDLKQAMQKAGVSDHPDIYFLDEVESTPA